LGRGGIGDKKVEGRRLCVSKFGAEKGEVSNLRPIRTGERGTRGSGDMSLRGEKRDSPKGGGKN